MSKRRRTKPSERDLRPRTRQEQAEDEVEYDRRNRPRIPRGPRPNPAQTPQPNRPSEEL